MSERLESVVLDEPDELRRSGRGLGHATRVQVTAHQFNSRRAALGLTLRRVGMESEPDETLAPSGMRSTQFAILAEIA